MADELVTRLTEQRASAWEQAKSLLDHAAAEGRDLSGEESEQFNRINDDIDALDSRRKFLIDGEARERAIDVAYVSPFMRTRQTATIVSEQVSFHSPMSRVFVKVRPAKRISRCVSVYKSC